MSRYAGVEELCLTQTDMLPPLSMMTEAFAAVCSYSAWRRHFAGWAAHAMGSALFAQWLVFVLPFPDLIPDSGIGGVNLF
jgi:hypothetical protein